MPNKSDEKTFKFKSKKTGGAEKPPETKETAVLDEIYSLPANNFQKPIHLGWKILSGSLLLAVIFGFLAGFGGGIASLVFKTIRLPFFGQLNMGAYLPKQEVTIKTQEKVTVTQDVQVDELTKRLQAQIVKIFPKKISAKKTILDQIYLENEAVGQGFVLTNDGWIVSASEAINNLDKKEYVVMTAGQKIYPVQEFIIDQFTGVIFLKIQAANLATVKLTMPEYLVLGQQVLVFGGQDKLANAYIGQLRYSPLRQKEELVKSTDKFSEFIQLDRDLSPEFSGSPIINLKGEVVGLLKKMSAVENLTGIDTAVPVSYFKETINQVLKSGKITRPFLGVDYIDLGQAPGISEEQFKDLSKGAMVYGAPAKNSPAEEAGIQNRDVILKVNNDSINGWYGLTELIQEYASGDEIELTVLRGEKEMKIKVKLGTWKMN